MNTSVQYQRGGISYWTATRKNVFETIPLACPLYALFPNLDWCGLSSALGLYSWVLLSEEFGSAGRVVTDHHSSHKQRGCPIFK